MTTNEQILQRLDRIESMLSRLIPDEQLALESKHALLRAQGVDLVEHYKQKAKEHTRRNRRRKNA